MDNSLVEGQKNILPLMFRSHRLLTTYIYYSVSIIYLWLVWVIFFILWIQLPLELGLIAFVIIALPIVISPILYKNSKKTYSYIIKAKRTLEHTRDAIDMDQFATGISSYITLLFNILKPDEVREEGESVQESPVKLSSLRIKTASQSVVFVFLVVLVFQNFFIPEIVRLLEIGGILAVLANPVMVLMGFLLALMICGFVVIILWELTVRRWLRIYTGFQSWGEEIERMVRSDEGEGGLYE